MCRLIGFASPVPTTLTEQIGKDEVAGLADMSVLHADGWGTAWPRPEAALRNDCSWRDTAASNVPARSVLR
jgi:glutamine amidotransferase